MTEKRLSKIAVRKALGIGTKSQLEIKREKGKNHMKEAYAAQSLMAEAGMVTKLRMTNTSVIVEIIS